MDNELEKLSVDILDEDLVRVFDALHLQQRILGTLRVNIKYGFATPPTKIYSFYKIIIWFLNSLTHIAFIYQCETAEGAIINDYYLKLAYVINFGITLIVILRNVLQKNHYHTFYVNLQKIDRDLHMKNKKVNKYLSFFIRSFCGVTSILGISWNYLFNLEIIKGFCLAASAVLLPGMANIVDLSIILVIIFFILIRLCYMNKKLKIILEKHQKNTTDNCPTDNESVVYETNMWNNLLNGMSTTMTVVYDFTELFQYQIFCFTCQVLMWIIITIQCVILTIKNQVPVNSTQAILITSVILIMIAYFITLCIISEYYSSELLKAKNFCIKIKSSTHNDNTRRNAKRMLLLVNSKSDLSVFGIYTLSNYLPIQVLAIIATYTIVLLQFHLT